MKIVIPTIGSRGDVQPFIALSQGLIQAGHSITLASHPVMKTLVESHGVTFAPIGPDINLAEEVAAIRHHARNTAIGLIRGMRFGFDMLERSHDDILAQCQKVDLVVVPTAIAAGKNEAELLNLPYLSVTLMPWAIPWNDPDRPIFKRIVYSAIDGLVRLITTRPLNRIRKRQGLPPVGKEGFSSTLLNLVPVSPAVYAPNPLWEPRHQIVGYWFAEAPDEWKPPADLLSFLESGDPPVLISLGAMSLGDGDALESANLFVDAIQQADVRAIIQGWEAGIKQLTLSPNIYATGSLPHSWLLPRCAGVVHHGGFGTTAAGLRAGKPALVIPHIVDQFYWGQQVHDMGAGPQPIRRAKLDTNELVASLDDLVRNEKLHATASILGEKIRSENGIENAVRLINETFA
ncbi:MAG: glycosyltransferase [Chloroflexota bacterium]|nr:glycosyltransferase [Chloroflexota bacterium]